MNRDELIVSISRMMAAAYWRGRLEQAGIAGDALEPMIQAAAEIDREKWEAAAKVAAGGWLGVLERAEGGAVEWAAWTTS